MRAALDSEIAPETVRIAQKPHMTRMVIRIGKSLNTGTGLMVSLPSFQRGKGMVTFLRYCEHRVITIIVLEAEVKVAVCGGLLPNLQYGHAPVTLAVVRSSSEQRHPNHGHCRGDGERCDVPEEAKLL